MRRPGSTSAELSALRAGGCRRESFGGSSGREGRSRGLILPFGSSPLPSPPPTPDSQPWARGEPTPSLGWRPRPPPPFLRHKVYLQQKGARIEQPRGRERELERELEGREAGGRAGRLAGAEQRKGIRTGLGLARCSGSHRPRWGPGRGFGAEAGGAAQDGAAAARGRRNLSRSRSSSARVSAPSPRQPPRRRLPGPGLRTSAAALLRGGGAGGVGRGSPRPAPPE